MNIDPDISTRPLGPVALATMMVLGLFGCSFGEVTPQDREWVQEYATAPGHEPREAEQILEHLARTAPDDEKRRDAQFDRARMALKRDDPETARQRFRALIDERDDDNVASRSMYELGRIAAEHDEDDARARRLLTDTVLQTFPWAGSELALDALIRLERDRNRHESLVDALADMAEQTDEHRLAAQLHYERGAVLLEDLGRDNDALDAFRSAFDRCAECASTDQGLYRMATIYIRRQQFDPAVDVLETVAARDDTSAFVGTYTSLRASDARYRLGRIELVYRQNYEAATRHFEAYLDRFGNNPDADRVAWYLVDIQRLDGTDQSYREALEQFIRDYPESRYVDQARARLEQLS